MSQVRIADGVARLHVGAPQPTEAADMAVRYLERRGYRTGEVTVFPGYRPKVGISGYRTWRVMVEVRP